MEGNIFSFIHLWVIILSIIFVFVFLIESGFSDNDSYIVCGMISCIIFIVSAVFFCVGAIKCVKSDWIVSDSPYAVEKIVSLNDNNSINGNFYMRRGYVEEKLYYQYIVELDNGGFVTNKVDSANTTLFYSENNYRVEWYKKKQKWLYWESEEIYNKIYIPEGSIADDYSIDLN